MRQAISKYFSQIFAVKLPQQQVIQEIYQEISNSLNKAYSYPETQQYIKSLSVQSLLSKSVEYYVGSRSTPRNQFIVRMLMEQAKVNAQKQGDEKLMGLVKYYYAYYVKMGAIKDGNEAEYDRSSHMFMELAQKGDHLSSYLVGKQIYKMVESGEIGDWRDQGIVKKANQVFINSLCSQQYGGMYYVADIYERHNSSSSFTEDEERMLFQLYVQSASLGYALSFFKIALIFKRKNNYKMYKKYLLKASELGVIEAQHNLGLQYASGQYFPKDEVKALAWFLQAAAHGFVYSKYNLSRILAIGTSCGRVKPNKKASLIYLQEINRSGELDVSKEIRQLVEAISK